ncbi:MAG: hypothetical protein PWQ71_650, partial [Bacteroidota bacterium]|nr:hypothetical protein [Bacteroidota bacterium]
SMFEQIYQISDWEKVEINYKSYEVASLPFRRFFCGSKLSIGGHAETVG